jgi:iron(III) transport system permease protein
VLIVLPMSWLAYFSLTDKAGGLTLDNFARLVTDPTFLDPLVTTVILATSSAIICCLVAAPMGWLVARTDMPLRRTVRALVTASFVTPPFLGAIAWELLAAPNSGLLNSSIAAPSAIRREPLFNIYSLPGLIFVISCYTFPYVFVLVANCARPHSRRSRGRVLDPRRPHVGDGAPRHHPLALPRVLAGALVAFLQAMTLFGSPAILALPAGFHTMTTKIWSLFQYPPKPELAAAASLPLLVLTVLLLRAEHMILGRRAMRWSAASRASRASCARRLEMGRARARAVRADEPGVPALRRAAQRGVLAGRDAARHVRTFTLHNIDFVFFELSATKLAFKNTFILGFLSATDRHGHRGRHLLSHGARAIAGWRAARISGDAPVAVPGIVLGVGLFPVVHAPALRALRHAVDPADRLRHHRAARRLPAASVGLPSRER